LLSQNPLTKAQFETFSQSLSTIIVEKHGSKPLYAMFLEDHLRSLCGPLKDVEVRKLASVLTALANEKQAAAKKADGTRTKKKPAAKLAGNSKGSGV
jgi:translation initiation factor 3 subunit J